MSREYFQSVGKLFPCPNKPYEFTFKRLVGQVAWAKTTWGGINESGNLITYFLSAQTVETPDGLKLYKLIVWKAMFTFGVKK